MVALNEESPLNLRALLVTLETPSLSGEELLDAYTKLTTDLDDGELSLFQQDIVHHGKRLVNVTRKHVTGKGGVMDSVAKKALRVMGYCLNDKDIASCMSAGEATEIIHLLIKIVTETTDKHICSHTLWCLSRQTIGPDIISAELPSLLKAVQKVASVWWGKTVIIENEALTVITRLGDQCKAGMTKSCPQWAPLLLQLLVSGSHPVRSRALDTTNKWASVFAASRDCQRACSHTLRKIIEPELTKNFNNNMESYTLKVCSALLQIFRKEVQLTAINGLLPILALAFRSSNQDIRFQTFRIWGLLIDIFAENNCLIDPKMVEFVMRVFRTRNTATEAVAMVKLNIWWHYVQCLGPRIWHHFEQILRPLLLFCLGTAHHDSAKAISGPPTPAKGRPGGERSDGVTGLPSFPVLQQCGLEILAHLLRDPARPVSLTIKFTLHPLETDTTISMGVFLKNGCHIITAVYEFTKVLASTCSEILLLYVWQCLTTHMRSALERSDSKRHEVLSSFLTHFQLLVASEVLPQQFYLKLFQFVCTFPSKVLSSTAFSIRSGDAIKGCPAQFLCEVLLTPTLLKDNTRQESLLTVFSTLLNCGISHPTGALEFYHHVSKLQDRNAKHLSTVEVLWRFWSIVANSLQEHISKTNEVNQGDALEYNFDCMYAVLLLPVSHHFATHLPQTVQKTAMKTWTELYRTFARLAAMVTNAEANVALEELAQKVLDTLSSDDYKESDLVAYLLDMCHVMVDSVDFSAVTSANPFMLGLSTSASKRSRFQPRPLGNLHSFVTLLAKAGLCALAIITREESSDLNQKETESSSSLGPACSQLVDCVTILLTHITVSSLVVPLLDKLTPTLAALVTASTTKSPAKLHTPAFILKLERLWQDVCGLLQSRYNGPYDSDLLQQLSPLLLAVLSHPRRNIKTLTLQMWNSTFGKASALTYPSNLQPVLSKLKEKTQLSLPGWTYVDVAVIDETPVSQMSQLDSQAPEPVLPGMPSTSPVRVRGSFLHKDVSPKPGGSSPVKRLQPGAENKMFGSGARKKLNVDLLSDKDFVVITNTPKKRRVLTEHQKEVMREKRILPVMYNNLDASQDMSLMSHFSTSDTQQDSLSAFSPTTDVIVVNSSHTPEEQSQEPDDANVLPFARANPEKDPAPRRSSRRRSVHFEDSKAADQESKDPESSITGSSLKSHGSSASSLEAAAQGRVEESSSVKSSPSQQSKESVSQGSLPSLQPNLMAAMGDKVLDTFTSSRETSQSVKSSSGEAEQAGGSREESDPFFRPFRSVSQSLPRCRSLSAPRHGDGLSSTRHLTRKTVSQDEASSNSSRSKSSDGGIRRIRPMPANTASSTPVLSSFQNLLKKAKSQSETLKEAVKHVDQNLQRKTDSETPKEAVKRLEVTDILQEVSPPRTGTTLVEETQSPKKMKGTSPPNISISETPPKVSPASSPEEQAPVKVSSLSARLQKVKGAKMDQKEFEVPLGLKLPIVQLERLPTSSSSFPSYFQAAPEKGKRLLKRSLSEDEVCSQGFSTELNKLLSPSRPFGPGAKEKKVKDACEDKCSHSSQPSSPTGRKSSSSLDHATLFGFSELLGDDEAKDVKDSDPKECDCPEEPEEGGGTSEELFTNAEPMEVEKYNPELISTLRSTPVDHLPSSDEQPTAGSSQAVVSEQQEEKVEACADSDPVAFNPSLEPTLKTEHAKKRKQKSPKKIADPQLLRRTPRKKKDRKSMCSCCKEGTESHHQDSPSRSTKLGKRRPLRSDGSQGTQDGVKSPVRKRVRRSLGQNSQEKKRKAAESPDKGAKEVGKLSPQDIGEKTPEMKTNSTPLRHSTTKHKLEAARRRSISLEKSLGKAAVPCSGSDSDSDNQPLSQVAAASSSAKQQKEEVKLYRFELDMDPSPKASQHSELCLEQLDDKSVSEKTSLELSFRPESKTTALRSPPRKILTKSSKLILKRLTRSRFDKAKALRSPPKLRLRQRKIDESKVDESSSQEGVNGHLKIVADQSRVESLGNRRRASRQLISPNQTKLTDFSPKTDNSPKQSLSQEKGKRAVVQRETMEKAEDERKGKEKKAESITKEGTKPKKSKKEAVKKEAVSVSTAGKRVAPKPRSRPKKVVKKVYPSISMPSSSGTKVVVLDRRLRRRKPILYQKLLRKWQLGRQCSVRSQRRQSQRIKASNNDSEQFEVHEEGADLVKRNCTNTLEQDVGCGASSQVSERKDESFKKEESVQKVVGDSEDSNVEVTKGDNMDISKEAGIDVEDSAMENSEALFDSEISKEAEIVQRDLGEQENLAELAPTPAENVSFAAVETEETSEELMEEEEVISGATEHGSCSEALKASEERDVVPDSMSEVEGDLQKEVKGGDQCNEGTTDRDSSADEQVLRIESEDKIDSGSEEHAAKQVSSNALSGEEKNSLTADSSDSFFPHNQAGLELEDEELELSLLGEFESGAHNKTVETQAPKDNGESNAQEVLAKEADGENQAQVQVKETDAVFDQSSEDNQTACNSESEAALDDKCHATMQTSPEPKQSRKLSKKEILDLITESDIPPAEIIAALQLKNKSKGRRLFSSPKSLSPRSKSKFGSRGMRMLQESLAMQRQNGPVGYLAEEASLPPLPEEPMAGGRVEVISSPSASPSISILKRRMEEAESSKEGLSTPSKKRRVSFADPVISGESPAHEATLVKAPDYFDNRFNMARKVEKARAMVKIEKQHRDIQRYIYRRTKAPTAEADKGKGVAGPSAAGPSSGDSSTRDSASEGPSQPSQSQNSYHSTQESQFNDTDPIFPKLIGCDRPVDLVMNYLTFSTWNCGLSRLLKAKGISTIGDLAAMTEKQVQELPIRTPRASTVRKSLGIFGRKAGLVPRSPSIMTPLFDRAEPRSELGTEESTASGQSGDADKTSR